MKRIYFSLLLAAFSYNAFCQQDHEPIIDSIIKYEWDLLTNDWVGYERNVYTYDANGNQTEDIRYYWDSETNDWVGNRRYVYTYDANGNQTEYVRYNWDSETNDWVGYERNVYTYDANGNQTEYVRYNWDSEKNDWVGYERNVYTYDANGNQTERIGYWSDSATNDWIGDWRYVYTYDANGNQTEEIGYDWNSGTNDWIGVSRRVYTYDANGNQTEYVRYNWDSGTNDWIGDWRDVHTYDANGNRTEYVSYDWDSGTNEWVGDRRYVYTYDANGNQTEYVSYDWDSGTNDWVNSWRNVYTYNTNGNQTEYVSYDWDSETNEWVGNSRYVYTYDAYGNQTEDIRYYWDSGTNEWVGDRRYVYTYDANGNQTEYVSYDWDSETNDWKYMEASCWMYCTGGRWEYLYDTNGKLTEKLWYGWDSETNEWVGYERYIYAYDANGNQTEYVSFNWDSETNDWIYNRKVETYSSGFGSSIVFIPDTAFLYALIDEGVDTNGDSLISYEEAEPIKSLDISKKGISNLRGIGAFIHLDSLNCQANDLTRLDVQNNRKLSYLDCSDNQITGLELARDTSLTYLDCSDNQITRLAVSQYTALKFLDCSHNLFTLLDISENVALDWLDLSHMPTLIEVCVWTEPFPPADVDVDTTASPNMYFTTLCECDGDYFEENDHLSDAIPISENTHHEDLFVSGIDDDWYKLFIDYHYTFPQLSLTCSFNHLDGDINMDLLDSDGVVIASSSSKTDDESIEFPLDNLESCFLHVYLSSGTVNSYSLFWGVDNYIPNIELSLCRKDAGCNSFEIDPLHLDTTYILDTLSMELLAGDKSTETITFQNNGPDLYYFYTALDCSDLTDSLNHAITFNGVDGYIRITGDNYLDITGTMTLEAWIRNESGSTGESPIISKGFDGNGYELYITGDEQKRRLGFRINPGGIHSCTILEDDRWYHVAATYDTRTIRLFINGILDTVANAPESISVVNQDLFIGTNDATVDQRYYFGGVIDEVRIWNRARTGWEIHSFMHSELTGREPGLLGYWPMNTGTMRAVIDHVSGNNGLLVGGATRILSSNPVVNLIKWSPDFDIIQSGSIMDYTVEFNAANLNDGDYFTNIHFISHDPAVPDIILPTRLHVTDAPSFSIQPDSVTFGEIAIYKTNTGYLEVVNHGSQTLHIDSIQTEVIGSKITPGSVAIEPGERMTFEVDVFMREMDQFSGNIIFYTNDPSDLVIPVPMTGEGNSIERFALLGSIVDTVNSGYFKIHGRVFPNLSTTHELILEPSTITYSIPKEINDRIPQPDSVTGTWVTTLLPESSVLPPGGNILFGIKLDASELEFGDYYADFILDWINPEYHKGFIPIRLHVRDPVQIQIKELKTTHILVYPNPVIDLLTLELRERGEYFIEIISMNGQILQSKSFTGTSHQIDLSFFQKGFYFITVRSKDFVKTEKIIKL